MMRASLRVMKTYFPAAVNFYFSISGQEYCTVGTRCTHDMMRWREFANQTLTDKEGAIGGYCTALSPNSECSRRAVNNHISPRIITVSAIDVCTLLIVCRYGLQRDVVSVT